MCFNKARVDRRESQGTLSSNCVIALAFIGPCIVVYFHSKTNQIHQCLKFILLE